MDILNFVLIGHSGGAPASDQLVRDQLAEYVLVEGERQLQLTDITLVMLYQSQTTIKITIQRGELIQPTVQRAACLSGKLRYEEWRERHVHDDTLKSDERSLRENLFLSPNFIWGNSYSYLFLFFQNNLM